MASPVTRFSPSPGGSSASPSFVSPPYTEGRLARWVSEHGNLLQNISSLAAASRATRGDFFALVSDPPGNIFDVLYVRLHLYPSSTTEIVSSTGLTEGYYGKGDLHIIFRWHLRTPKIYASLLELAATTPANRINIDLRDESGEKYTDQRISEILARRGL